MLTHDLDHVMHRLEQIFEIFGKHVTAGAARIWRDQLAGEDRDLCLQALDDWTRTEKHAPRPCNIKSALDAYRVRSGEKSQRVYRGADLDTRRALQSEHESTEKPTDPRVTAAWIYYHREIYGGPPPGQAEADPVPLTRDEWIEIINREAIRVGLPDAIDPGYRLDALWIESGVACES